MDHHKGAFSSPLNSILTNTKCRVRGRTVGAWIDVFGSHPAPVKETGTNAETTYRLCLQCTLPDRGLLRNCWFFRLVSAGPLTVSWFALGTVLEVFAIFPFLANLLSSIWPFVGISGLRCGCFSIACVRLYNGGRMQTDIARHK